MNTSPILESHVKELIHLNNLEVPNVNELDYSAFCQLLEQAAFAKVIEDEYAIAGFVLGFEKGACYEGFNFNWFSQRLDDFLYIDRIVVNPAYRGKGVGKQLYIAAEEFCLQSKLQSLCCEVNLCPNNPGSHHFHQKVGFAPIAEVEHPEGKLVQMYQKRIMD